MNANKVPALTLIFWIIKIAATTLGETGGDAVVGDFFDKPVASGGLALSRYSATVVLFAFILGCILIFPQKAVVNTH